LALDAKRTYEPDLEKDNKRQNHDNSLKSQGQKTDDTDHLLANGDNDFDDEEDK
jgi:hypothetical protein